VGYARRVLRRRECWLVAVLLLVFAPSALGVVPSAVAASATLSVSPTSGPPTTLVTAKGTGFLGGERVSLSFDGTLIATVTAGGAGGFSKGFTVGRSARPGQHTVKAVGKVSGRSATAVFTVRTNWPQFRNGPAHNGFNRYENVISPSNASKLHAVWTATAGVAPFSPAVADGSVYVASPGALSALSAKNGAKRWSVVVPNPVPPTSNSLCEDDSTWAIASSPAASPGRVLVGSTDGKLYAFGATHGTRLWSAATGGPLFASPTVSGNTVYIGSRDGYLYAFNLATGSLRWRALTTADGIYSSAAIQNGVAYVGGCDGSVYAFAVASGARKWRFDTGFDNYPSYDVMSSLAVAGGVVYVNSWSGLLALNATTGALLWSQIQGDITVSSSPAVANGVVYVGTGGYAGGGNFYGTLGAYDATTGANKWNHYFPDYVTASPAVANGVVYVTSEDGYLSAFNAATGTILKHIRMHIQSDSSPAVSDGRVVVSDFGTTSAGVTISFGP
jgi:outer membrane protein assembly factor BamB